MIFDKMERLAQYKGLHANLDILIDTVLGRPLDSYAPGKNEINENCWINNNPAPLKAETDLFERHNEFIDLQIPLESGEIITVRPMEDIDWPETGDETVLTHAPAGIPLDMAKGMFAIFFPGDAHNCSISKDGTAQVAKLVGKAHI